MKNNNLHKNQPHARALSDDSLENVAGGWRDYGEFRYILNDDEIKILRDHGWTVKQCGTSKKHSTFDKPIYTVKKGLINTNAKKMKKLLGEQE